MSHNTPSVTVGIIARNEEKNIINTLEHIVKQDYPHDKIEIIIVDGNSTDKTREMAEEFLKKQNIRYSIYNEAREPADKDGCSFGHSFARNIVLRYMSTSTDYIGWIDADCRADPSWLSTLVNTMETTIDNNVV
ncbi:MAG: glycosyltransferase [Patescibacteria group bacterium]